MMTNSDRSVFVREAGDTDRDVVARHRLDSAAESAQYRGSIEQPGELLNTRTYVGGFAETVFGSITVGQVTPHRWHVSHVFVEPPAREVGIGDALLQHVLHILTAQGAKWISAQALPGDRSMKNLFERHGLVAQTITVGKSLNDPSN